MLDNIAKDVLDAVPLPMAIIGADARITAINQPMQTLLGADLTGRNHVTALRQPAVLDAIANALSAKIKQTARYLGRDGQRDTIYDVTATPFGGGVIVVFEDQSAMTEVGQLRRDFVANVSHELRTPLTALIGFIETLQGPARNDPAAQQRFLQIMGHEADRMRRLVDDLLSLSRVEEEARVRPKAMVDLTALVPSVVAGLAPLAQTAATPLKQDLPDAPLLIPADDAQLRQVLNNLIENAIKYAAGPEGIEVRVTPPGFETGLKTQGVRITVRDFGEGIASHHLPRLTERFYRVDTHRSREVGGTGLGLAIVKHIVNRHRGRLHIASEAGTGTVFTIILPANLAGESG